MRLVKYLTLAIPMSRNQAKFFIKRGRVTTDGKVQTDPDFEKFVETKSRRPFAKIV